MNLIVCRIPCGRLCQETSSSSAARNVPGGVDRWSVLTSFFRSGVIRVLFGLNAYPRKGPLDWLRCPVDDLANGVKVLLGKNFRKIPKLTPANHGSYYQPSAVQVRSGRALHAPPTCLSFALLLCQMDLTRTGCPRLYRSSAGVMKKQPRSVSDGPTRPPPTGTSESRQLRQVADDLVEETSRKPLWRLRQTGRNEPPTPAFSGLDVPKPKYL
jgi:hypothetical protein